jgi:hypothetical protein
MIIYDFLDSACSSLVMGVEFELSWVFQKSFSSDTLSKNMNAIDRITDMILISISNSLD